MPRDTRPSVLFAMVQHGDGHRVPAEASAAWLERRAPGRYRIEVLDLMREVGAERLDDRLRSTWNWMLRYPSFAYYGQRFVDGVLPARLARFGVQRTVAALGTRVGDWLQSHPYDVIVSTHYLTSSAIATARQKFGIDVPLLSLNVDAMDAHVFWSDPRVDAVAVYSERAARDLRRRGYPHDRIHRIDPVLRPEFTAPCSSWSRPVRARLGVPDDAFVVLWSAGGEGIGGPLLSTVSHLGARTGRPLVILAMCGRNERLHEHLQRRSEAVPSGVRLVPLRYRTDVRDLVCASDLVVGKAGPSATFEALVSRRPYLFHGYAAANEYETVRWVVESGAGRLERNPRRLAAMIRHFLDEPEALSSLQAAVDRLAITNGGPEFARWIDETWLRSHDRRSRVPSNS